MSETVKLFGIPVAKVTEAEAVERIVALAKKRALRLLLEESCTLCVHAVPAADESS